VILRKIAQYQNPALILEKWDFKLSEPFFIFMVAGFRFKGVWQFYNNGTIQNNYKRFKRLSKPKFSISSFKRDDLEF
jgi:hypothetical protein